MIHLELYKPQIYSVQNFITGKKYIFCGNYKEQRSILNKLQRKEKITTDEAKQLKLKLGYNFPEELDTNTTLVFGLISPFDTLENCKKNNNKNRRR